MGKAYVHTLIDDHSRASPTQRSTTTKPPSQPPPSSSGPSSGSTIAGRRRASPVRQRRRLPLTPVERHLPRAGRQAQAHEAVSAPDQRQDRALPPNPGRRLGLRPHPLRRRPHTPPSTRTPSGWSGLRSAPAPADHAHCRQPQHVTEAPIMSTHVPEPDDHYDDPSPARSRAAQGRTARRSHHQGVHRAQRVRQDRPTTRTPRDARLRHRAPGAVRDNACIETFYACLKREWLTGRVLASQADAEQTVYVYIDDFYNTTRLRQHCGLPSPNQYEARYWATRTQKDAVERKKETEKEKYDKSNYLKY